MQHSSPTATPEGTKPSPTHVPVTPTSAPVTLTPTKSGRRGEDEYANYNAPLAPKKQRSLRRNRYHHSNQHNWPVYQGVSGLTTERQLTYNIASSQNQGNNELQVLSSELMFSNLHISEPEFHTPSRQTFHPISTSSSATDSNPPQLITSSNAYNFSARAPFSSPNGPAHNDCAPGLPQLDRVSRRRPTAPLRLRTRPGIFMNNFDDMLEFQYE